jgi:hypothetical protein
MLRVAGCCEEPRPRSHNVSGSKQVDSNEWPDIMITNALKTLPAVAIEGLHTCAR